MGTSHRSADTHAWATTGTREPVFVWTPSDPTAGRALLGRVRPEREGGPPPDRLRFGTYLASNVTAVDLYEQVTEEVGRRLGVASELVVESSYESCEKDQNEVCFVCSLPYVTFERRGLDLAVPVAAPVLQGVRYGGGLSTSPTSSSIETARSGVPRPPGTILGVQRALLERFVPVDAGSYDDIRMMVDACEAAGFLELS